MKRIGIIVDSGSDIPQDAYEDVTVLPMSINFDGTEYKDGVDIDHKQFYELLIENNELPQTSQINPAAFMDAIDEGLEKYEKLLIITISSGLSGTYQSACIAASEYEDQVMVIDSLSLTVGQRILVDLALDYINMGLSLEEVADKIEQDKTHIHIVAMLDTLEYLKKGGRIPATAATIGNVLSLKPVVTVIDGKVALLGTARGSKKANNFLNEQIQKVGGIDFSKPLYTGYTGLTGDLLDKYITDSSSIWTDNMESVPIMTIGSAIGTHVGPGAIAIGFYK